MPLRQSKGTCPSPPSHPLSAPITFYHRYHRRLETEAIYGESFLRWAYENPFGRLATWALVKRGLFSRWYGWRMSQPASRSKVAPFIATYGIDTAEMADAPESFTDFNAFFSRKLVPTARPIAPGDDVVVFPADGRHWVIPDLSRCDGLFVKGVPFDLATLLGNAKLAQRFAAGGMMISRLCPVDYHRFHFPVAGVPREPRLIDGPLFSVSPIALRQRPTLLWENKRYVTLLRSERFGEVLLLEVGATCVGKVVHTAAPGQAVDKGAEKGYFLFGGSCFITVFEPGRVRFDADLVEQSAARRETYARMGDHCAVGA